MELFSVEFLSALAAIIVIDLVLAGDNAIVIALAARTLPKHLQRRAVIWGAAGAIVVRSAMTIIVVALLKIPGLLFVGGALLVWIAYKLLIPENGQGGGEKVAAATSFWGAIKTIIVADMVMGLDNVLAVAGAAHGSFLLVVLGLLISIPIVIWGSTMLLRLVERYPAFVYLGAGVLALTAAKMIGSEPYLKDPIAAYAFTTPLLYIVIVFGILWSGLVKNHRQLQMKIGATLAKLAASREADGAKGASRVLVPVAGYANAQHAVQHVLNEYAGNPAMQIHMLNVQPPFSRHIARFVSKKSRDDFHRDRAEQVLRGIKRMLEKAGVAYTTHVEVGDKARLISEMASRLGCDRIVMGTARKNSVTRMLEDSVTSGVLETTTVPVEVVVGDAVSRLERFGVPTGIAATLIALFFIALY